MKTLRRPSARRSSLGQAPSDDKVYDLRGELVRGNGVIYRVGYVVNNTKYFSNFHKLDRTPDNRLQVRLIAVSGPSAGSAEYAPLDGFFSQYALLSAGEADQALDQFPLVAPKVSEDALENFYKTVQSGLSFAENALSQARLGNQKDAQRSLDLPGAGASAMLDKAYFDIHELEDYRIVTPSDRAFIMLNVMNPLAGLITDARSAMREGQTSSILGLWNAAKELTTRTAVQWTEFGSGKWKEVTSLYKGLLGVISSMEGSVAQIESARDPELSENLSRLKKNLALIKFQAKRIEEKVVSLGVTRDEWNKAVGLGEMSTVTIIVLSTVLAVVLGAVLQIIIEWIKEASVTQEKLLEQERQARARNRTLDEEEKEKLRRQTELGLGSNLKSAEDALKYLKELEKLYPGTDLQAKIRAAEDMVKASKQKTEGMLPSSWGPVTPYLIAGGVAITLAALVVWVRREKESY